MLVFAYLVVVPSAALMLSRRLHVVITLAILMGIAYTIIGLIVSFVADSPTNPTIIAVLTAGFGIAAAVSTIRRKAASSPKNR